MLDFVLDNYQTFSGLKQKPLRVESERDACSGDLQKVREALLVSGGTSSACRELPVHVQSVKVVAVQVLHSVVGKDVYVGRAGHQHSADTDVVSGTRAAYRHIEADITYRHR